MSDKPIGMTSPPEGYAEWLADLKGRIHSAQQRASLAVNLDAVFHLMRAEIPLLTKSGGGAIVNMLSLVALASMPGPSVYNASKAAAWSMTQSLRASLSDCNIRVHGVSPGAIDTEMLADVDLEKASPIDVAKAILDSVVEGREDIFPDAMSTSLYAAWVKDHKAVEQQFANM